MIGRRALAAWQGNWSALDPTNATDLYDLRFVGPHLEAAGRTEATDDLWRDQDRAAAWRAAGLEASAASRYHLAAELATRAAGIYGRLVHRKGRDDLTKQLSSALLDAGTALADLGRLPEALASFDAVVELDYRLVGEQGQTRPSRTVIVALQHKGIGLSRLVRASAALAVFDAALVVHQSAGDGDDRRDDDALVAAVLTNQRHALRLLGRPEEALEAQEGAIAV